MRPYIIFISFLLIYTGCGQKSSNEMYDIAGYNEEVAPAVMREMQGTPPPQETVNPVKVSPQKIIKDGNIGLLVENLEETKRRIDTMVNRYGGYYANENFQNNDYASNIQLKVRIPSQHFEKFILDIESGKDDILFKNTDARDVTEEFIDLETRLENKRNYLKRYNELLKQAKSIKDILEIEEKTRQLEEEIESTVGRLKYLTNQVSFSTLSITLTKEKEFTYKAGKRDKFFERLKQSLSKGWHGFVDVVLVLLRLWPFWIVLTLGLYTIRKFKRPEKKEKL